MQQQMSWRKCPSVTAGGKPHFWVTYTTEGTVWVMWSRTDLSWGVWNSFSQLVRLVADERAGKAWVESHYTPQRMAR